MRSRCPVGSARESVLDDGSGKAGRSRDELTVSRVAEKLGVSWHTANNAVLLAEGRRRLIDDPAQSTESG